MFALADPASLLSWIIKGRITRQAKSSDGHAMGLRRGGMTDGARSCLQCDLFMLECFLMSRLSNARQQRQPALANAHQDCDCFWEDFWNDTDIAFFLSFVICVRALCVRQVLHHLTHCMSQI